MRMGSGPEGVNAVGEIWPSVLCRMRRVLCSVPCTKGSSETRMPCLDQFQCDPPTFQNGGGGGGGTQVTEPGGGGDVANRAANRAQRVPRGAHGTSGRYRVASKAILPGNTALHKHCPRKLGPSRRPYENQCTGHQLLYTVPYQRLPGLYGTRPVVPNWHPTTPSTLWKHCMGLGYFKIYPVELQMPATLPLGRSGSFIPTGSLTCDCHWAPPEWQLVGWGSPLAMPCTSLVCLLRILLTRGRFPLWQRAQGAFGIR